MCAVVAELWPSVDIWQIMQLWVHTQKASEWGILVYDLTSWRTLLFLSAVCRQWTMLGRLKVVAKVIDDCNWEQLALLPLPHCVFNTMKWTLLVPTIIAYLHHTHCWDHSWSVTTRVLYHSKDTAADSTCSTCIGLDKDKWGSTADMGMAVQQWLAAYNCGRPFPLPFSRVHAEGFHFSQKLGLNSTVGFLVPSCLKELLLCPTGITGLEGASDCPSANTDSHASSTLHYDIADVTNTYLYVRTYMCTPE